MILRSKKMKTLLAGVLFSMCVAIPTQAATYTVKNGDSLYKIGNLFNVSYSTIMSDNKLSSSMIYPGQKLNLNAQQYTVKKGDSLYLIAKAYGVSVDSLRNANNKWDNIIYPGDILLIPGKTSNNISNTPTTSTSNPRVNYTAADLDLLARLVMAEAQDQPYSAKVAVAAVVLNRVQSSAFPNTISSVIYQRSSGYYQFTPVENGWINKAASQDSINAAREALNGADPSKGAIYYFDDSATNKWLWSRPLAIKIGKMVFTY